MFTKNVGNMDRVIRIMAGSSFWYLAYLSSGTAAYILGFAGLIAIATGLAGWCGVYVLLKKSTRGIDEQ